MSMTWQNMAVFHPTWTVAPLRSPKVLFQASEAANCRRSKVTIHSGFLLLIVYYIMLMHPEYCARSTKLMV